MKLTIFDQDRDDDLPRTKEEVIEGHKSVMKYFRDAYDVKYTPYVSIRLKQEKHKTKLSSGPYNRQQRCICP